MARRSMLRKLSIICLISSTVPSANALSSAINAAQALGVLQRDTASCPSSNSNRCSDPKLPSNFCCPSSSTCISLDDSTTALCCPKGGNCANIKTIPCDIQLQNITTHPDGAVLTTKLNVPLSKCGNACCPHGYSCQGTGCVVNKQASSSSTTSSSTSAAASSTSSSSPTSTPSNAASSASPTCDSGPSSHCSKFPAAAVVAGFFPGLILGVLLTLVAIIFLGRRSGSRPSSSSSKISHLRTRSGDSYRGGILGVSDPITDPQKSARTDFLRRDPPGPPPTPPHQPAINRALSRTSQKVRSLLRYNTEQYPMNPVTPPQRNYVQEHTPPRPGMPQGGLNREPSMESIKVYSPAYLARQERSGTSQSQLGVGQGNTARPQTTFTEMMERSGFTGNGGSPRYNVQNPGNTPKR